jgi:long-chain acyl-CoA synthetase
MPKTWDDVVAQLTGPGGPFEIQMEEMGGRPLPNFANRERSIREKLRNAGQRGEAECMVQGERRISYGEFTETIWGSGHRLRDDYGLQKGERLAVLAFNSPDWLMALFGAVSVGGVGVGLNGWWSSEEIEYGLTDSGARFLVVDDRLYSRVEPLAGKIDTLEHIFYIGDSPPPGTVPISELLVPDASVPDVPLDEDDPFVILYTSGTTGRSKGCITTHRGTITQVLGILFANVAGSMLREDAPDGASGGGRPKLVSLLTSPLFHVGGLHSGVLSQITAGGKMVFSQGRFDPEQVMQLIEREKINTWGAIPTMLHRVVHHEKVGDYDLSSLRSISFGGAPTPPETLAKAQEVLPWKPTLANAYGLTETHGVATVNGGKDLEERSTSAGRPIPVVELQIVDEAGQPVPDGQLGQIVMSGPTITPGYWNRPDATAEAIVDGWLQSGDLGYRSEGFVYVVDRAKDMILRGGENVYCVEIENCLAEHPEIDEAAIVGVPDPELGERVKAIVRRHAGSELTPEAVRSHVAAHMASFKVPEFVDFIEEPLPRNPAGKILKNALRGSGKVPFSEGAFS